MAITKLSERSLRLERLIICKLSKVIALIIRVNLLLLGEKEKIVILVS